MFGSLKIVELGEGISAAFCTKLFADLGAEVIKVEPPGGDIARRRPPFLSDEPGLERSGLFAFLNTNKLGVTLDVAKRQGYDVLVRLLRDADILVENNPPRWMANAGLDYQRLRAMIPTLIVTSITPFGQDGPWRDYLGNGFIASHTSGFAYDNGQIDADLEAHPPLAVPWSMAEFLGGMAAASATMCALFGRSRGGGGTHVDMALQEALASFLGQTITQVTYAGHVPGRKISEETKVHIGQIPAADGYINLTIRLEEEWRSLMGIMGNPAWNGDEFYASRENRRKHPAKAWSLLGEETRRFKKQELAELCQTRGIPAGPVNNVADLARDEHLQDREWFGEFDHPVIGHVRCPGPPVKIGNSWNIRRPAPLLGQHNREVFGRYLEYSEAKPTALSEAGKDTMSGSLPLKGVRVADFGWALAAPFGTSQLARMGAEVIKVEGMSRLDDSRIYGPYADGVPGLNRSSRFNGINAGKLSVTLELANPDHVALAKELVAKSDVVIENFSYGTMEKFGLAYDVLKRVRPEIIMLSCSGFGHTGRLRAYRAFAKTVTAYSGLNSVNGYTGGEPKPLGDTWADYVASVALVFAVTVALHHRDETGRGQYIDLSMMELTASLMGVPLMDYFLNERVADRQGNSVPGISPNNVYRCKGDDAWVAVSVETEEQWDALCRVIDATDLMERPDYRGVEGRSQRAAEIDIRITRWTKQRTSLEAAKLLQEAGVPSGPSCNAADLLAQPQLRARGFFVQPDHPEVGRRDIQGMPWRLSDKEVPCPPAPLYGEHNQYVLGTLLGHSQETIDRLNAGRDRAIGGGHVSN